MIAEMIRRQLIPITARATSRPQVTGMNRILILQPDHLGDVILSEPAVRFLRAALPDSEMIAVVGPWSAEIAGMAWRVDRVVEVEFPGFTRQQRSLDLAAPYRYLLETAARLRQLGADDALVLRDDAWWAAWLARASTGRHVLASDDPQASLFATETVSIAGVAHRTDTAMRIAAALVSSVGGEGDRAGWDMSPTLPPGTIRMMERLEPSGSLRLPDQPYVVLHPGSGAAVKSWPVDRWRAVVRGLGGTQFVLTGSEGERSLCKSIAEGLPNTRSIAGKTPLPLLAQVLEGASLAIGTDNGPMHLAGAVGTPTVRLFGPSNPARYGPWPGTAGQSVISAGWSCPRCEDLSAQRAEGCGCMIAIEPRSVVEAIQTALDHDA